MGALLVGKFDGRMYVVEIFDKIFSFACECGHSIKMSSIYLLYRIGLYFLFLRNSWLRNMLA